MTEVDTSEMLLIHRVIRREIGRLPALVRAAAGDPARAARVGAHATEMLHFLHSHHHGEDELLYPLVRERVSLDADLMERMDAQHLQVAEAVTAVEAELPAWTTSADAATGERIAARLDAVLPVLIDHLAEEETELLPVVATTVTQAEWDQLGKHGLASIRPPRRLVILGHILEESDDAERARFLRKVPAPARLAFRLVGRRQHARETGVLRA